MLNNWAKNAYIAVLHHLKPQQIHLKSLTKGIISLSSLTMSELSL